MLCNCDAYPYEHSTTSLDCESRLLKMTLANRGWYIEDKTAAELIEENRTWELAAQAFGEMAQRGGEEVVLY